MRVSVACAIREHPEHMAMQMTGHKTHEVFERYSIVSGGDLPKWRKLNSVGEAAFCPARSSN